MLTINVPVVYMAREVMILMRAILIVFALCCAQGNLGVKKVEALSKYPLKCPTMYFACNKLISQIFKISSTLKVPKHEIFTLSDPIWVGDLGTEAKNLFLNNFRLIFTDFYPTRCS
jgi:hypothetical protein